METSARTSSRSTDFASSPTGEIASSLSTWGFLHIPPKHCTRFGGICKNPQRGDDRQRYQDANSLQALGGTSPVLYQSGMYSKAHRRLGCIKPLRNALHQFAWQSTQSEAWAKDYYQRKRTEGKSHTVAIRALANVWVRIIFAMWIQRECYQTATFTQAQLQHARTAA